MRQDVECPYCETWNEICHDDGFGLDENTKHEMQCERCEKYFVFETEITYLFSASKAACLNGGDHEWMIIECYPEFMTRRYCPCGMSEFVHEEKWREEMAKKYIKKLEMKE
jgi:hypothetical protein